MKITKFTHSCILAETPDRVALFDPGEYSWEALGKNLNDIERVDRLAISHIDEDHCSIDFISALIKKFPSINIVCNDEVESYLKAAGIRAVFRGLTTACTRGFDAQHGHIENVKDIKPKNSAFHFLNLYTHSGDSLSLHQTTPVLGVPFISNWGSVDEAIGMVVELNPKIVIPIHDWHYQKRARDLLYEKLQRLLPEVQIAVLEHGESIEI